MWPLLWQESFHNDFMFFYSVLLTSLANSTEYVYNFVEKTATECQTAQNVSNVNKQDCDQQHSKKKFAVTMVIRQ